MERYLKIYSLLLFFIFLNCSSTENAGIETGNPNVKTVSGKFDVDSIDGNSFLQSTSNLATQENCGSSINNVQARATDLSETLTAVIQDNYTFEMQVDANIAYYFVIYQDSTPCGYLTFPDTVCDFEKRAIVGGGTENVNLGTITYSAQYYTENNPSESLDYDDDGIVDAFDDDMNGDGIEDFDGNYDHFINVLDSTDTASEGQCDFTDIQGEEIETFGTITVGNNGGTLVLTTNQEPTSFETSGMTLYNVDDEQDENVTEAAFIATDFPNNEIRIALDVDINKDYVLTIPIGSLSCTDGAALEREVRYYFRTTASSVSFACGSEN